MHKYSSVDPIEVEKFDKLSHKWQDENGEFKALHKINHLRLKFIEDKIKQHYGLSAQDDLTRFNIIDVGCGGGLVSMPLSKKGANITAIDASYQNIEIAKTTAFEQGLNIEYINTTVEELRNNPKKYDIVICLEVIEHVANVENFITNLTSILESDGMLILSTINRNIKSYFLAIIMAEYILKWVPKETHDFKNFLKPSEIDKFMRKNKLGLKELKGITFNPLLKTWSLNSDIEVNYIAYYSARS